MPPAHNQTLPEAGERHPPREPQHHAHQIQQQHGKFIEEPAVRSAFVVCVG